MNVVISPDSITRQEILSLAWRSLQPPADEGGHQNIGCAESFSKPPELDATEPTLDNVQVSRTRTPEASVSFVPGVSQLRASVNRRPHGGGILLLVVPAVESVLLVRERRQELARGRRIKKTPRANPDDDALGIFRREGVRTKHFTSTELAQLLEEFGFLVLRFERVIYDWDSEIPGAGWMGDPRPFDWLVISQRSGSACNLHDDSAAGVVLCSGNAEEGDA